MKTAVELDIFVRDFLNSRLQGMETVVAELKEDSNLIGSGIIDSFMFIDLCLGIEEWSGTSIDIANFEFDEFSIAGLAKQLEQG